MHRVVAHFVAVAVVSFGMLLTAEAQEPARSSKADRFKSAHAGLVAKSEGLAVSGACVGFAAQPGLFYEFAAEMAETGTLEQFKKLVQSKIAVVRAAGMYALAQKFPKAAVPILKELKTSQAKLSYQPSGCSVHTITEGELAEIFLKDAKVLEALAKARPLE